MSWKALADAMPELAAFGKARFETRVAYLATVRKDGSPRVHPVTPIVSDEHLFVFMEPTSPKGHDLRRDGRCAIHNGVPDSDGTGGEFIITGRGTFIDDPAMREIAVAASSYKPAERYILFELSVESASSTIYADSGPVRQHWRADENLAKTS